jgi:hypothetical protein
MRVVAAVAVAAADERPDHRRDGSTTVSTQSPASDWPDSDTHGSLTGSVVASAANTLAPTPNA